MLQGEAESSSQQSQRSWWQTAVIIPIILIVVGLLIWTGYVWGGDAVGFAAYAPVGGTAETNQRAKTLWDWLDLLIVPLILSVGAYLLNRTARQADQEKADNQNRIAIETARNRAQQAILEDYLKSMTELLLTEKPTAEKYQLLSVIARARTLTNLQYSDIDGDGKGSIVRFLQETGLIVGTARENALFVDLGDADLTNANLQRAELPSANFSGAQMEDANLTGANLRGANLIGADLSNAILTSANLSGVELSNTRLHNATLTSANLKEANLAGAVYDAKTKWPAGFKPDETMVLEE